MIVDKINKRIGESLDRKKIMKHRELTKQQLEALCKAQNSVYLMLCHDVYHNYKEQQLLLQQQQELEREKEAEAIRKSCSFRNLTSAICFSHNKDKDKDKENEFLKKDIIKDNRKSSFNGSYKEKRKSSFTKISVNNEDQYSNKNNEDENGNDTDMLNCH
eukprot:Pgem_evm1s14163